ncbi:hypothetical protein Hanom_Chr12g01103531 [Helianthus anomalus]
MGGCKLRINVVWFVVDNARLPAFQDRKTKSQACTAMDAALGDRSKVFKKKDFRSYSNVLAPETVASGPLNPDGRMEGCQSEKVVIVPDKVSAFRALHGKAVMGRTVDLDTLISYDRLLRIGGVRYGSIQYLGGLSILVSFERDEEAPLFWRIKNSGVDDQDLTVKCVGVLVGQDKRVKEVVNLRWRDRKFRISIVEEENEWVLDYLGSPEFGSLLAKENKDGTGNLHDVSVGVEGFVGSGSNEASEGSKVGRSGNMSLSQSSEVGPSSKVGKKVLNEKFNFIYGEKSKLRTSKRGGLQRSRNGQAHYKKLGSPSESRPRKRIRAQLKDEDIF